MTIDYNYKTSSNLRSLIYLEGKYFMQFRHLPTNKNVEIKLWTVVVKSFSWDVGKLINLWPEYIPLPSYLIPTSRVSLNLFLD